MAFQPIRNATKPNPLRIAIDNFRQGVWRLVEDSRIPHEAVKEALNMIQTQDGRWSKRPGTAPYGADLGASIDGAWEFVKADGSTELLALAGGTLYRLNSGGTKTAITGATFTTGIRTRGTQIRGRLYLSNGVDNLAFYNGSTIATYSNLTQPVISGITKAGLTNGSFQAHYAVLALNEVGHSLPSATVSVTGGTNKSRNDWTSGDSLTVNWSAITGATRYEIYYNDEAGTLFYLDNVPAGTTSYVDTGRALKNEYTEAPIDNTSLGAKFAVMELSGNRIWATQDPNNRYRVYFGGVGSYQGSFSAFYGGGWIDLEKGGRETPTSAVHFRDGKGSSQVTVLTASPEGTGSIWQIELIDMTIGNVSFVQPTPVKIVGSTGSNSPDGVVKAGDSVYFINKRGAFSLGSRPNLLNVLSTREISGNIRPFMRSLSGVAMGKAAGYYLDGRLYWSVPSGSSLENNTIMVLDMERNNWNPEAFNIGVKQFLEHTTADGNTRFLAIPSTGTRLIEISSSYSADGTTPIRTSVLSGLYPITRNRLDWARMQDVVFEFYEPQGEINLQILGYEKRRGFASLATVTLSNTNRSNAGWGSARFNTTRFNYSSVMPRTFARASVRKRVRVNKLVNTWQYRITTSDKNASYTLLSVQPRGFIIPTRDPASWRATK